MNELSDDDPHLDCQLKNSILTTSCSATAARCFFVWSNI
jgi:hypothetical protein